MHLGTLRRQISSSHGIDYAWQTGPCLQDRGSKTSCAIWWLIHYHDDVDIFHVSYPLTCGDRINSLQHSKYHGCGCPGSLRRQDISTHDIDYVDYVSYCLTWGGISIACVMWIWRNDMRYEYMFLFSLKYLTRKGLTHWGRVTHICVSKLNIIGSDNGLSPSRRQAIIWTNAGILSIRPLETNFSEILIKIHTFSFKKIHLKMSSGKLRSFCLGLNELNKFSRTLNSQRNYQTCLIFN